MLPPLNGCCDHITTRVGAATSRVIIPVAVLSLRSRHARESAHRGGDSLLSTTSHRAYRRDDWQAARREGVRAAWHRHWWL